MSKMCVSTTLMLHRPVHLLVSYCKYKAYFLNKQNERYFKYPSQFFGKILATKKLRLDHHL